MDLENRAVVIATEPLDAQMASELLAIVARAPTLFGASVRNVQIGRALELIASGRHRVVVSGSEPKP